MKYALETCILGLTHKLTQNRKFSVETTELVVNKRLNRLNKRCQTRLKKAAAIPTTSYGPEGRGFESLRAYHCRQNLRVTIVIRRFCCFLLNYIKTQFIFGYNYISADAGEQIWGDLISFKPAFIYVLESEATMKIPYGYVLVGEGIAIHEERADVVRSIFEYYLAGTSLGK